MNKLRLLSLFLIVAAVFALASAPLLVEEHPEKSDVIVILGGDRNDIRYHKGVEMLRAGYGKHLLLDASLHWGMYGKTEVEYAEEFLRKAPEDINPKLQVCPYVAESTFQESEDVTRCMQKLGAQSALIVTSTYHTRRALSIFRKRAPGYHWTAVGAPDSGAWDRSWWKHRQWAKTHLGEWQRMLWWQLVDRWRA